MFALKQNLKDLHWKARTIRIRPDYVKLRNYLGFLSKKDNIDLNNYLNDVFRFSLTFLTKNGFNYIIDKSDEDRIPQYFPADKATNEQFNSLFMIFKPFYETKFNRKFYNYEFAELLLFIFAVHHLKPAELDTLQIDFGIHHSEL